MTFISYAQNFEDVMLRRALKDVDKGFYIDVGANDPVVDSVTKSFYAAGWRGINIEPVSEWFEKLQQDRPDDINLQVVVGSHNAKVNFYEVVGTGLSTMDESIATRHVQERGFELKKNKMHVVSLTSICEQYSHSDIHFLKIDVEGAELSVLQGFDLKKFRPWIILVESTQPNTQIEDYLKWEHFISERLYHYIYFDGLNRYYVANEHYELDNAFTVPPNFFDYFKRASEDSLERDVQQLRLKIDELNQSNRELQSVYRSKSWRITWPLRKLMQLLKWLSRLLARMVVGLVRLPKTTAGLFLAIAISFVLRRQRLKHRVRKWLYRHPKLEAYLRAFVR